MIPTERNQIKRRGKMRDALTFLVLASVSTGAFACSPVHSLDVLFEKNSASMSGHEILRLANWATDMQLKYSSLDRTSVGGLADANEKDPHALAEQRAESVKRLLTTLGLGRAPIDVDARLYRSSHLKGIRENGKRVEIDFLPGCPHECPCQMQ
ncbi:hypothetical protein G3N57_10925 [Paraburkholderia sp. Se-20369]|nr:hypothetical protein [Paraburkholderia sp. Se-20369]